MPNQELKTPSLIETLGSTASTPFFWCFYWLVLGIIYLNKIIKPAEKGDLVYLFFTLVTAGFYVNSVPIYFLLRLFYDVSKFGNNFTVATSFIVLFCFFLSFSYIRDKKEHHGQVALLWILYYLIGTIIVVFGQ